MSTLMTEHRTDSTRFDRPTGIAALAARRRATADALLVAAVEDYRDLLPAVQRERLLLICREALDSATADVERLAGDLLCALCPEVPAGVRDTLAWICGDLAAH